MSPLQDSPEFPWTARKVRREIPPPGFSLVELVYVLALLGVISGIAAPFLDVSRFRMDSSVVEVCTELMAAQRISILRGHDVVVTFDENAGWLKVHLDANNDRVIQDGEATKVAQLGSGVSFGRADSPTITPSSQTVTFQQHQGTLKALTFHRNGSSSEAGVIYLTSTSGSQPRANRAIEVIRSTAKVKCWSYKTGNWTETC